MTPRQLRLLFLMQSWRDPMNYSQGTLAEMLAKEKTIREFMLMVKTRLRDDMASQHIAGQRWNTDDEEVHKAILDTEKKVHHPCSASTPPMLSTGARRAVRGREHATRAQGARGAHPHMQQVRPCALVRARHVTRPQVHHGLRGAPGVARKSCSSGGLGRVPRVGNCDVPRARAPKAQASAAEARRQRPRKNIPPFRY